MFYTRYFVPIYENRSCILMLFALVCLLMVGSPGWALKYLQNIKKPSADVAITPSIGTFKQGEMVNLAIQIKSTGKYPIDKAEISFSSSLMEGIVVDYHNATFNLSYKENEKIVEVQVFDWILEETNLKGLWDIFQGKSDGLSFLAGLSLVQDQTVDITIPVQSTAYGNYEGRITVTIISVDSIDDRIERKVDYTKTISWVVLK